MLQNTVIVAISFIVRVFKQLSFIMNQKFQYTIFRQNKFRTNDDVFTSCIDSAIDFAKHSVNQKYADYDYSYVQNNVTKEVVFEVGTK